MACYTVNIFNLILVMVIVLAVLLVVTTVTLMEDMLKMNSGDLCGGILIAMAVVGLVVVGPFTILIIPVVTRMSSYISIIVTSIACRIVRIRDINSTVVVAVGIWIVGMVVEVELGQG